MDVWSVSSVHLASAECSMCFYFHSPENLSSPLEADFALWCYVLNVHHVSFH